MVYFYLTVDKDGYLKLWKIQDGTHYLLNDDFKLPEGTK